MTRLLRLRLTLGLTQAEAARRAGCSVPTWRAWEQAADSTGPWPSPKHTAALLPGITVQGWLLEGRLDQARDLAMSLSVASCADAATVAHHEAHLCPEVGREVMICWPDDLEEWLKVTGIRLDRRHQLVYETSRGIVLVQNVCGVRQ